MTVGLLPYDAMMECDVLVVGAGPAGSSAARAASLGGADTIFIDKKRELGVPIQCAGAIGIYLLPFLPFKIPRELLTWKIDELHFHCRDIVIKRKGGPWTSYAIDRSRFDRWLANLAVEYGAKLWLDTELIDLKIGEDFHTSKALTKRGGETEEISFKVLIAADGVNSTVIEKLGVKNQGPIIANAVSYELKNGNLKGKNVDQLYFGEFAPTGYAYIFPISDDRANIGVGSISDEKDLEKCFKKFCELPQIKDQIKDAEKVGEKSGSVPFSPLTEKWRYGNVLLAGDAAAQNLKPLVEGILPSAICGSLAGETAAKHISSGLPLSEYRRKVQKKMGAIFDESDKYTDKLTEISGYPRKMRFLLLIGLTSNVFSLDDVDSLKNVSGSVVEQKLIKWKNSRAKRFKTEASERLGILYLRLISR
ncbi:MAG: geranylgeranyl reductase family protein [Candidatus Hydrothermarchaeales archaeon]